MRQEGAKLLGRARAAVSAVSLNNTHCLPPTDEDAQPDHNIFSIESNAIHGYLQSPPCLSSLVCAALALRGKMSPLIQSMNAMISAELLMRGKAQIGVPETTNSQPKENKLLAMSDNCA